MLLALRRRYTVMIACQPPAAATLTRAQAAGTSCIRCQRAGADEHEVAKRRIAAALNDAR